MQNKILIKNTVIYALGDIVPKLLGFISFPILTKYLSPSDYGIVNYVNTLGVFFLAFGFLSLNTYYLVFYYRSENEESQKKLLGNLSSFIILLNAFFVGVLLLFGDSLFKAFGSDIQFYPFVAIGVISHFFNIFSVLPSALYRLLEKPMFLTIINIVRGVITLVLTLILVIQFNLDAIGVLCAYLIVNFIFMFIFLYAIKNKIIWNINLSQIKSALHFSLPLLPGSLAYFTTTISDRILIEKYLTLIELGIYSTAATLALILNIFSYGAYKAFEPYIFKTWGSENFNTAFEKIHNGFIYVLLIGALFLCLYSEEFFLLLTSPKFHKAFWYVPLIVVGVYSASVYMLFGTIITAREKTKTNSLISIVGAGISVCLNIILLPKFGLTMAALVSSFALTVMLILSIYYSKIKMNHSRHFISVLIVSGTIYLFVYFLHIENLSLSIFIKTFVLLIVIGLLSKSLAVHPISALRGYLKKR